MRCQSKVMIAQDLGTVVPTTVYANGGLEAGHEGEHSTLGASEGQVWQIRWQPAANPFQSADPR